MKLPKSIKIRKSEDKIQGGAAVYAGNKGAIMMDSLLLKALEQFFMQYIQALHPFYGRITCAF